jgi:hypothetical protein
MVSHQETYRSSNLLRLNIFNLNLKLEIDKFKKSYSNRVVLKF